MSSMTIFLAIWFVGSLVVIGIALRRGTEWMLKSNELEDKLTNRDSDIEGQILLRREMASNCVKYSEDIKKLQEKTAEQRERIGQLNEELKQDQKVKSDYWNKLKEKDEEIYRLKEKLNPPKVYEYCVHLRDGEKLDVIADDIKIADDGYVFGLNKDCVAEIKNVKALFKGKEVKQCGGNNVKS